MPVTLQNILDDSSFLLGESGTPTSEITKRTRFANDAKGAIAKIRHWSWELQTATALNYTYIQGTTVYTYTLTPTLAIKDKNAIYWLKFIDQNNTTTYFSPVDEPTFNNIVVNGQTDNVYFLSGNDNNGYVLNINGGASALPTQNVTNAWTYRYFAKEPDFANTTDTTPIPSIKVISEYVASEVLFGYREQAQYQLAQQRYQDTLEDLALKDMKEQPFQATTVMNLRQAMGFSNNFKTYY